MSDWPVMTLRDAGVRVIDCVHKTPAAQESGYPYIAIPQMKNGTLDFESARRVSREDFVDWTKKAKPQPHDVVLSRRTNPGVTAIDRTGTEFALGQNLVLLRADGTRVKPPFLKWLVRSPAWWREIGKYLNVGALFDSLRCADVPNFELPIPPLAVQHGIGGVLDALEDKIEVNRRMNETLAAMARALFKSWFVDFEPVRANVDCANVRLPEGINNLFPDRYDDSTLGRIPSGWKVVELSELIDVNPRRPRLRKGDSAPYVPMSSMPISGHTPSEVLGRPFGSGTRFINGDTLLARITPCLENGKTAFVDFLEEGQVGWGSTEYIVLRPKPILPAEFAYCLSRTPEFRDFAIQSMTGTSGRQRVQPTALGQFLLPHPPERVGNAFGKLVRPLIKRAHVSANESRALAQLRDAMLPKLISGEIRVPQAERVVDAVVRGAHA